ERPPVAWPGGKPVAVWLNISLEHFPLDPGGDGFRPHGAMTMPYPDLRHYTLRDYGNRVGVYRVLDALAAHGLQARVAVNAEVAARYPALARRLREGGHEWVGHGWNMDSVHHGGMDGRHEAGLVQLSLEVLREASGATVRG